MSTPRVSTEREWIAAAIKHKREELGLRQKDLAELISAAGPRVSQQMLGKIETGDKELTIVELCSICIALGVTLEELFFPTVELEDGIEGVDGSVVPQLVSFAKGGVIDTGYVSVVLKGERVGADTAAFAEAVKLSDRKPHRDEVNVEELFDLRAEMLSDPDARAIGELLELDAATVSEIVAEHASMLFEFLGFPRSRRKRVTAHELVDGLCEKWLRDHPEVVLPMSGPARRQVRTRQQRVLAAGLEEIIEQEKRLKK